MAILLGSAVLVAASIGMFLWALNRRGGREEIRKNAPLVVFLAVALVVVAIVMPILMSTSARRYVLAGAPLISGLWAFWTATHLGPGAQANRLRIGLVVLGGFMALMAVAVGLVLR